MIKNNNYTCSATSPILDRSTRLQGFRNFFWGKIETLPLWHSKYEFICCRKPCFEFSSCSGLILTKIWNFSTQKLPTFLTLYENPIKLKSSLSSNGSYLAVPNQCGTIRVFRCDCLTPIIDFATDTISKAEKPHFIPNCQFVGSQLVFSKHEKIIKCGLPIL